MDFVKLPCETTDLATLSLTMGVQYVHEQDLPLKFRKGVCPPGCRFAKSVTS